MNAKSSSLLLYGLAAVLAGATSVPAHAQKVGTTSAVNPASHGAGQTLVLGASVVHNERISTDKAGSVQLLFLDRTTMSIGPDSDVVIDEYVYDPNKGAAKIAVTLGKGLMRFVGGQVTHQNEATVQTPNAVIGIRGGTGQFSITREGTQAIFLGGNSAGAGLTVTPCTEGAGRRHGIPTVCTASGSGGASQTITTPGFGTFVGGGSLTGPSLVEVQTLAAQNAILSSRPGSGQSGGGGARTAAAVVRVANEQAASVASSIISANTPPVSGVVAGAAAQVSALASLSNIVNNAIQTAQTINQQTAAQQAASSILPPEPNLTGAFALSMTNCCDPANPTSPVPYLPGQFAFGGNIVNTPVFGIAQSSGSVVTLQYGINFTQTSGEGGFGQQSWLYVATGAITDGGSNGPVYFGNFTGTQRAGLAFSQGTASGTFSGNFGNVQFNPTAGVPTLGTVNQNRFDPTTKSFTNQPATFTLGQVGPPTVSQSYSFVQNFSPTAAPSDLGANRPVFTSASTNGALNGYAAGLMQTVISGSSLTVPYLVNNQNTLPTDVAIQLDPTTSSMQANFNLGSRNAPSGAITTAGYQFGSLATSDGRSAYIDYNRFGALAAVDTTGNPLSIIDGFGITNHSAAIVALSAADAAQIGAGLPGSTVSACQCDFTRWGVWSTSSDQGSFTDMGHAMFWVAGQLPQANQVPTVGLATYTGHAIANIANGNNQYIAAGNFSNTVNFGAATNQMQITVSNFDAGDSYTGVGSISSADRRNFGATLNSTTNRTMTLDGSFFKGTAGPVGEMGGQLAITGTNYTGAGIFAARTNGVH